MSDEIPEYDFTRKRRSVVASTRSQEVGRVEATAPTREQAIEKLRGEIRYRLDLCPCSGETYQRIKVEIVDSKGDLRHLADNDE